MASFNNRLGLVLEDFDGSYLSQILKTKKLTITISLKIAIEIAKVLDYLHKNQVIHKDIKPSNIINTQEEVVKLKDFGVASRLFQENTFFNEINTVEGTLAYMSPEQTGRMNRNLDYRTDFYYFGV